MAANEAKIVITADDKASGQLDSISQKAKSMRTAFLAVSGAVAGVGIASIKFASDLDESVNKATVTFGNAANVVREFGESSASAFGISERAANEYSGTLGTILNASGLAESASAEMSVQLVKLAADMASFNNIPIDVALEKLRSGLVGEVEPLRTVGVLLSAAEVNAEAYAKGIAETGAQLTEAQKVQARYSLILSQTTAQQGDFTRTSDSLANSTRIMKAQLEDAAAELGQQLLPAAQKVVEVMNNMIGRFSAMSQGAKTATLSVGGVAGGIAGIGLAIPPVITGITLLRAAFTSLAIHPIGAAMTVLIGTLGLLILKMRELENETNTTAMSAFDALDKQVRRLMVSAGESGTALSEQDAAMQALINTAKDYAQAQNEATLSAAETVRELNLSSQGFDSTSKASQVFSNRLKEVNKELKPDLIQKVRGAIEQYGLSLEQIEQIAEASGIEIAEFGTVAEEAAINTAKGVEANEMLGDSFTQLANTAEEEAQRIVDTANARIDAEMAIVNAQKDFADEQRRIKKKVAEDNKNIAKQALIDELKFAEQREDALKALAEGEREKFEELKREVMGLPKVISTGSSIGANAMRAFKDSQNSLEQQLQRERERLAGGVFGGGTTAAMVEAEIRRLESMLNSDQGRGVKLGEMILAARGQTLGGAPPMLPGMNLNPTHFLRGENGMQREGVFGNTYVVNGDVYGFEDFADKVEQAQTQNRDAGAIR